MSTQDLKQMCQEEIANLRRLAADIMDCCDALRQTVDELEPFATAASLAEYQHLDVKRLAHASTEELHAKIAEYNARLLWRNAVSNALVHHSLEILAGDME